MTVLHLLPLTSCKHRWFTQRPILFKLTQENDTWGGECPPRAFTNRTFLYLARKTSKQNTKEIIESLLCAKLLRLPAVNWLWGKRVLALSCSRASRQLSKHTECHWHQHDSATPLFNRAPVRPNTQAEWQTESKDFESCQLISFVI